MGRADELLNMGVAELVAGVRERRFAASEVVNAVIARVEALDPDIGACLHMDKAVLRRQARKVDAKVYSREDPGALAGVPVGIKDVFTTEEIPTTCGSKILEGYVPPYSATVVRRIAGAGGLIGFKLNCDEFAMGSSNENSAYKPVKNPWDRDRVPGGSSGGSAAAVAARMFPVALGSDTGGSIRQPAALCGVTGMKPSYGRVSRYGLIAFASSLDCPGPLARNVDDVALVMEAICGYDPKDSTSVARGVPGYAAMVTRARERGSAKRWVPDGSGRRPLRIGLPKEYLGDGCDEAVVKAVRDAVDALAGDGAEVEEISLPHTEYALAAYYIIAPAEASSNLARYDGVRYGPRAEAGNLDDMYAATRQQGFGPEVRRRIMLGTYALSAGYYDAFYLRAQKARTLVRQDFEKAFEKVDLILGPTSPVTAFKIGERVDPLDMYQADILTIGGSLAGIPALSIPCGFDDGGLPIGLQIMGPHFAEADVLRCGARYQALTDFHTRQPDSGTKS